MLRRTFALLVFFSVTAATLLGETPAKKPATPLGSHEIAARDFIFEGVRLGMPEAEVRKLKTLESQSRFYPDATGTTTFYSYDFADSRRGFVGIYRDRVYLHRIVWDEAAATKAGGATHLLDQVVAKFGDRHAFVEDRGKSAMQWTFPRISRNIEFLEDNSDKQVYLRLTIRDNEAEAAATKEQRSKIKTGLE